MAEQRKARSDPITREKIERYLQKDKELTAREHANHQSLLVLKQTMLKQCEELTHQLVGYYDNCCKDVQQKNREVETLATVHHFLRDKFNNNTEPNGNIKTAKLTETEEEDLNRLNKIELAKKDLEAFSERKKKLSAEVEMLTQKVTQLSQVYAEHDKILGACFEGKYGSKKEKAIEEKLDGEIERKQRVQLTHYKWNTALALCQHSVTQLDFAINRWQEIGIIPISHFEKRYKMTSEVRNYLVCAIQNLATAQKYLTNVTFPYCTPQEVDTLHTATVHIYNDVTTVFRHAYALQCFSTTQRRAQALVDWFQNIIQKDMMKDLNATSELVDDLVLDLRQERLLVMKRKLKETSGDDISLAEYDITDTDKTEFVTDTALNEVSEPKRVNTPAPVKARTTGNTRRIQVALGPTSEDEMGNVSSENVENEVQMIKKQHEKDMEIYAQAQQVNKVRMEQGLSEKLNRRRRSKLLQLNELNQAVDSSLRNNRNLDLPSSNEETSLSFLETS